MSERKNVGIGLTPEDFQRLEEIRARLPFVKTATLALEAFRLGLPLLEAQHLPKQHAEKSEKKAA